MFKVWIGDLIRISHGWIPGEYLYEKELFNKASWDINKVWILIEVYGI